MSPTFFDASGRDVSLFILSLLLRASLLLAAALVCESLLRARGYSLIRASCWNGVLTALVMLPLTIWAVPPLRLPWLPASRTQAMFDQVPPLATEAPPAFEFAFDASEPAAFVREPSSVGPVSAAVAKTQERAAGRGLLPAIPAVYALGTVLLLLRLAWSARKAGRLVRGAQSSVGEDWVRLCARCRSLLGVRPPVRLCVCDEVRVPVALGWLSPHVLIPRQLAVTATAAQRESILLHELAHIRRNDYAWQLLLHVVQALYWPNPLIWLVGRRISQAREQVCDEVCTHYATSPGDYRDTLLHVAAMLVRRPSLALGICMARTPQLADRLHRIAQGRRSAACVARPSLRVAIGTLTLVAIGMLGATDLVRAQPTPHIPSGDRVERNATGTEPASRPALPVFAPYTGLRSVRVLDVRTDAPVMGATVTATQDGQEYAPQLTGEHGHANVPRAKTSPSQVSVLVRADGYRPTRVTWTKPGPALQFPQPAIISLEPGGVRDRVQEVEGTYEDAAAWARSERSEQILQKRIDSIMNGPISEAYEFTPQQRDQVQTLLERLKAEQLKHWEGTAKLGLELRAFSGPGGDSAKLAAVKEQFMQRNRDNPFTNMERILNQIDSLLPPEQARAGRARYETRNTKTHREWDARMARARLAAGEGGRRVAHEDGWAVFVEEFCSVLDLSEDQRATALSVLRDLQGQCDAFLDAHRAEIEQAVNRRPDYGSEKLLAPLEPIWEEFRSRLDSIPTTEQVAMMKRRRPLSPATRPTDYVVGMYGLRPQASQPAPPRKTAETPPWIMYEISGHVVYPGPYRNEKADLTLSQAIRNAGGIGAENPVEVLIERGPRARKLTQSFTIEGIVSGAVPDPKIESGDRIVVRLAPPRDHSTIARPGN